MSVSESHAIATPRSEGRSLADTGFWGLIFLDLLGFTYIFCVFMVYRDASPESSSIFAAGRGTLSQFCALLNTVLLLTSSWFVVMGLDAARKNMAQAGRAFFKLAMACGVGFLFVKAYEYTDKVMSGLTLNTDLFYNLYFMVTVQHLIHLVFGLGVLAYVTWWCLPEQCDSPENLGRIETGAIYWHMVDLIWIALFTLIFLVA